MSRVKIEDLVDCVLISILEKYFFPLGDLIL